MALSNTTRLKCRACGTVYPTTYSLKEHSDREHCDGPLDYYCDTCRGFVPKPETICPVCEQKAQLAAEKQRRQEERQRDIAERKQALERQYVAAKRTTLSALARRRCREDGRYFDHTYTDEEHHDIDHCDGPIAYFCESCAKWQSGLVCAVCEDRAQIAEKEEQERLERERQAAAERERLRRQREEQLRLEREKQARREKAFARMVAVPACIVLATTILSFLLSAQLFTHGGFFIPYSGLAIVGLLVLGIASTLSIFVVAMFFSP
jgi:uncharacterized Zn finger protein (UPF0148 family)